MQALTLLPYILNIYKMDIIIYVIAYLVVAFIVATEGSLRGYTFSWCLLVSLLTTPLISAILFSNYKPENSEGKSEAKKQTNLLKEIAGKLGVDEKDINKAIAK